MFPRHQPLPTRPPDPFGLSLLTCRLTHFFANQYQCSRSALSLPSGCFSASNSTSPFVTHGGPATGMGINHLEVRRTGRASALLYCGVRKGRLLVVLVLFFVQVVAFFSMGRAPFILIFLQRKLPLIEHAAALARIGASEI